MDTCIAVAAEGFGTTFQGLVYDQLRRLLPPRHALLECAIPNWQDSALARGRLLGLLDERPLALIAICLRPDFATVAGFRDRGIPIVLVDERAEGASTVASDNLKGGYLAGQHLVRKGRRSLAVVTGPVRDYNAMQRMRGVANALSEGGLPLPADGVIEAPAYSYHDGLNAMARLLAGPRKVDGVVCAAGDTCATGLLVAARHRGVKVPDDLAVIGWDDAPLAATTDPPLTTMSQSLETIARETLRLAVAETTASLLRPQAVLLEPRLVIRASA